MTAGARRRISLDGRRVRDNIVFGVVEQWMELSTLGGDMGIECLGLAVVGLGGLS